MNLCADSFALAGTLRTLLPMQDSAASDSAVAVPAAYLGVWQRLLLETPQGLDTQSQVYWLQTPHWHADLRIPSGRPDFSGVRSLAECSDAQLAWLATQQGFCGVTQVDGDVCTWQRRVDFQPADGSRDIGRMAFDGERVVETGVDAEYLEIWKRLPESRGGHTALQLVADGGQLPARPTWLLVAGDCFLYVRGRSPDLSKCPVQPDAGQQRAHALAWLDFELSFGHRNGPMPWGIERSTLPFREGQSITQPGAIQRRGHQLAIEGNNARRWMILDWDLGASL